MNPTSLYVKDSFLRFRRFAGTDRQVLPRPTGSHRATFGTLIALLLVLSPALAAPVLGAPVLTLEVDAAYNLVVDSNVLSPSTYAPAVATVNGKACNYGTVPLTNVQMFIGDFSAGTPGTYPSRDSADAAFQAEHPHLSSTGTYSFTHLGGATDAARWVGNLAIGECKVQYWHFTYPRRGNPDNTGDKVWGNSNTPDDDLWLTFDMWTTSAEGATADLTRRATMRNEISANANKIEPSGGLWFNEPVSAVPGSIITTNGVNYDLGNINKGFDNDGDLSFDYNAWLQPIGDPSFDPTCYRLIKSESQVIISRSGGQPDLVLDFVDQLYYPNLPADNTGGVGTVVYSFMVLRGPCSVAITPYQEVASGADNEKFSGDYGASLPRLDSSAPEVTLDKNVDLDSVLPGGTLTYSMDFENIGTEPAGLVDLAMPLVLRDSIPTGTSYAAGTAAASLSFMPNNGVVILYSTDGGTSFSETEPADASTVTDIQWWLQDNLPAGGTGSVTFDVTVDSPFGGAPFVINTGEVGFGSAPPFDDDSTVTLIQGTNTIGDLVWSDDDGDGVVDGGEAGIADITVELYYDVDGDGELDADDILVTTASSDGSGNYSFDLLPDGNFLVAVDTNDPQLPTGFTLTTDEVIAAFELGTTLASPFNDADFGFRPALSLAKTLTSSDPATEAGLVTYDITLTNNVQGGEPCVYTTWAQNELSGQWTSPTNAVGAGGPDGLYANSNFPGNKQLQGDTFDLASQVNAGLGAITQVEAIFFFYVDAPLVDDFLLINTYANNAIVQTDNLPIPTLNTYGTTIADAGLLAVDVTASHAWDWPDFDAAGGASVEIDSVKTGGADGATSFVDALGFRVTSSYSCSGASASSISPLPVTDTYDADLLQFVSASPAITGQSFTNTPYANTGVLSWSDVGPLNTGQSTTISVTFTALEPPDNDADGENDSAVLTNTGSTTGATFSDGTPLNDATDDAVSTLNPTGSLAGTVWNDNGFGGGTSANGTQDGGEQGIPGVTVQLFTDPNGDGDPADGVLVDTQVTDANGDYLFDGLGDDNYVAVVSTATLPGSTFTQTGDPDATLDNQGGGTLNNNDGSSANDDLTNIDFGYTVPNAVYGNVWQDHDGNGTQDSGENGIAGVTVRLEDCGLDTICGNGDDGATVTVATAADGSYLFEDLVDGNYRVVVDTTTLPAGGTWTQTVDPDATVDDQTTSTLVVSGGQIFGAYDFAYQQASTSFISDLVYADWNGDGDTDTGEEGLAGVTVNLYEDADGDGVVDPEDALIATTVTDADGLYSFTGLPAGDFIVQAVQGSAALPNTYQNTQDPDESGLCTVCDGSASVTLDGVTGTDLIDFGYQPVGFAAIGDLVWNDANGNGIFDSGESGLENITLTLYEDTAGNGIYDPADDALVSTTFTDATGFYQFPSLLPAGSYIVFVDTTDTDLPTDGFGNLYVLTTSDTDPYTVTLAGAEIHEDADFGFGTGAIIGDTVWRDDNGDGLQSETEIGLANITVSLYNDVNGDGDYDAGTDTLVATDVTDSSGNYEFNGLPAGEYVVVMDLTDPDLPSTTVTGDPDATADGETGLTVNAGDTIRYADFGVQPPGVIGDTVWIDDNGDGVFDPIAEEGIAGVTVELRDGTNTLIATTTTDSEGNYSFGDLANDTYTVTVVTGTLPANISQTYDPDEGNGCVTCDSVATVVLAGGVDLTIDFGYQRDSIPILDIDKDTSTPDVTAGGQATYTIAVRNSGTATATDVTLADTLPTGFTYASSSVVESGATRTITTDPTVGDNALGWGTWDIDAGGSITVTFVVDIGAGVSAGTYDNTASLSATNHATIDDDGTVPQDADTPKTFDPEDDEDVTVGDAPLLTIVKTSDGGGSVNPGDTVTYTMVVTNTGSAIANNVTVTDAVPTGSSYVAASSQVTTPVDQTAATYADDFETGGYAGSTGTVNWAPNPWAEISDDGNAATGDVIVTADGGDNSLRIRRAGNGASRQADLSTGATGTLTFSYRREAFDNASDFVTVEISDDGGSNFDVLDTFDGATVTTDATYQNASYDISDYLVSNAVVRFLSSGLAVGDLFFVDDLQIEIVPRANGTFAAHDPSGLVTTADGYDLLPAEIMTVTFQVLVDNPAPLGVTDLVNTAFADSDELPPVSDTVSETLVTPNAASIGDFIWEDENGDGDPTGESGIENVLVRLYTPGSDGMLGTADDVLVATTFTDATGAYDFTGLSAGSYRVDVDEDTLPSTAYTLTTGNEPLDVVLATNSDDYNDADFGYQSQPQALPVTLASFSSWQADDTLHLEWITATEAGNVGFYLWARVGKQWQLVHQFVPSRRIDSIEPQTYRLAIAMDEKHLWTQKAEAFLLEDIDTRGTARFHGPFQRGIQGKALPMGAPIPWQEIRERQLRAQELQAQLQKAGEQPQHRSGRPYFELGVFADGVHRVTWQDLAEADDRVAQWGSLPSRQLALLRGDEPQPIFVSCPDRFQEGCVIEFVGAAIDSQYTDRNVYRLVLDPRSALRPDPQSAAPQSLAGNIDSYPATHRVEENRDYSFASPNGDPWYDRWMLANGAPLTTTLDLPIEAAVLGDGPASLKVEMWGVTNWPVSPDHHVQISLNGVLLADEIFDGLVDYPVEVELPPGLLQAHNELVIHQPQDVGGDWDLVALEAYGVTYARRLEAPEGRLTFESDTAENLRVNALPSADVAVYRQVRGELGQAGPIERLTDLEIIGGFNGFTARFAGTGEPTTYWLATDGSFLRPQVRSMPKLPIPSRTPADYLIVTHGDFRQAITPLADARRADGYAVEVVDVNDLYQIYSGGVVDPNAIRDYVRFAAEVKGARFLLLVGGDTYDYKDRLGVGSISFIPSLYAATSSIVQYAPTDTLFADVDDDGLPELAVGRLPVRTVEELEILIGKILAYAENTPSGAALFASDAFDGGAGLSFADISSELAGYLGPDWSVHHADIDDLGLAGARAELMSRVESGVSLTHYFGHSGPTLWSFLQLFTTNDAAGLTNHGLPSIFAQWGCWNTYYVTPTYDTMGHELLLGGDRGGAAVLGAATLTEPESDLGLAREILPLLGERGWTIGGALTEAKRRLGEQHPEMVDILLGWTLLGDPAMAVAVEPTGANSEQGEPEQGQPGQGQPEHVEPW